MQNIQALDSRLRGNDRKNLPTTFFDAHTHASFPAYNEDRDAVIKRAKEVGVKMVTVGTQVSSSRAAIELAHEYPEDIWATVGYHPAHAVSKSSSASVGANSGWTGIWHHDKNEQKEDTPEAFDIEALEALARDPKVVAIGECGLDYYVRDKRPFAFAQGRHETSDMGRETKDGQKEVFIRQIELANRVQKPLMIHCRSAFPDLISILHSKFYILHSNPGVIHFFSGTLAEARELLDMGFAFTFGGVITFSRDYDEVIKILPLEKILSETDAPYVTPEPYRGKRNEPAYVVEVVKKLAEIKSISVDETASVIRANIKRIFGV